MRLTLRGAAAAATHKESTLMNFIMKSRAKRMDVAGKQLVVRSIASELGRLAGRVDEQTNTGKDIDCHTCSVV